MLAHVDLAAKGRLVSAFAQIDEESVAPPNTHPNYIHSYKMTMRTLPTICTDVPGHSDGLLVSLDMKCRDLH